MGRLNYDLSIIIPTYNVDKYISETIKSIIMQKTNYLYEVIFIDDGSCDNTVNIIEEYIKKNDNFKLYIQSHQGAGAARNKGIKKSSGKYIYFFDSDDLLVEGMIESILDNMFDQKLDIMYFSGSVFLDRDYININFRPSYHRIDFNANSGEEAYYKMLKTKTYTASPCLYVCKKEILLNNNLFFPEKIMHEDNFFTFFLILCCKKHFSVGKKYYKRRIRQGSVMTASRKEFSFISMVKVYEKSLKRISTSNLTKGYAEKKYIDNLYKNIFHEYSFLEDDEKKRLSPKLREVEKSYQQFRTYPKARIRHYYYWIRRIIKKILGR